MIEASKYISHTEQHSTKYSPIHTIPFIQLEVAVTQLEFSSPGWVGEVFHHPTSMMPCTITLVVLHKAGLHHLKLRLQHLRP